MLMFISFPSILESGLSWGHWHLFNLIEHQPTGCVNILSKRPLPVGASFTRDLAIPVGASFTRDLIYARKHSRAIRNTVFAGGVFAWVFLRIAWVFLRIS